MQSPRFILERVGQAILVIVLSYTLVFFTLFVLPGNPIENKINNPQNPLPTSASDLLISYYNLDRSPFEQFVISIQRLLSGDLGFSLISAKPVKDLITQAAADTLVLALTALVFTVIIALAVALTAVFGRWKPIRTIARSLPLFFLSTPSFLVGFLLLLVFSFQLGWVSSIRDQGFISLILPALTLAIAVNAPIAQVLIQGLEKSANEPFVTVLRAKGVPKRTIVLQHILKNGSIPAITLFALTIGDLVAGAVVVETVFNRTGIGFLTQQAVRDQDTPVILVIVMIVSFVFVVLNLLTDLLYPVIDPRISLGRSTSTRRPKKQDVFA